MSTETDPFQTYDATSEASALRQLMDSLPIYATRVGFRFDSTDEERALGDALFKVHTAWQETQR